MELTFRQNLASHYTELDFTRFHDWTEQYMLHTGLYCDIFRYSEITDFILQKINKFQ